MSDAITALAGEFSFFSQCTEAELALQVAAIEDNERRMIGRHCGSLRDKVFQSMACLEAARHFPADSRHCHMEIGVLFGGSLLAKLAVLSRHGIGQTVLGVDPFEGYYGEEVDPLSKLPVTIETVEANIATLGQMAPQAVLLRAFSDAPQVMERLNGYSLVTLMIDGDHSYAGVEADWRRYAGHVLPGGIVLFDDYSDPSWPEVTRFVDDLLASKPTGWRLLGHVDTTLALVRE